MKNKAFAQFNAILTGDCHGVFQNPSQWQRGLAMTVRKRAVMAVFAGSGNSGSGTIKAY